MQYSTIGDTKISRLSLGTKRLPTTDVTRVVHLDVPEAETIFEAAVAEGITCFDTAYNNRKGEAESALGTYFAQADPKPAFVTSYFEMVDPRYEYVFQKQLKKLQVDRIDFYYLEGVGDITQYGLVDSGIVDFLFKMKEEGKIKHLGFDSDMSGANQVEFAKKYPWDFVRLSINYFDWFNKKAKERYDAAMESELPIFAHSALRVGLNSSLKQETLDVLRAANPTRPSVEWGMRFVKSLEGVATVSSNVYSVNQLKENAAIFNDDVVLTADELEVLKEAAAVQKQIKRVSSRS
ncbi:MAG: aldo/keto reductase [Coriobacteriia bacterium]|nr:aldo/keto reductase [Coriobacteriia bacterium]